MRVITFPFFAVVFLLCLFNGNVVHSQSYDFKVLDSSLGLPQNYVYCTAQSNDGYLWMGTGEGLVRYDGLKFVNYSTADSLASDFIYQIFISKDGMVWVGHENGTLSRYNGTNFQKIIIPESSSIIKDICQASNGDIWCVEQNNGLIRIDDQMRATTMFDRKLFGRRLFYSILELDQNIFLVGTSEGLIKVTIGEDGTVSAVTQLESIPEVGITTIVKRKLSTDEFWIGTEGNGFYLYEDHSNQANVVVNNNLCLYFKIENEHITDIIEEDEGHLLLATWGNGVIKLIYDYASKSFSESMNFSQVNGLSNNHVKNMLHDIEGNYWFATYGGGVSVLINDYFVYYNLEEIGFKNNNVNSVLQQGNDLWMGLDNGILKTDPNCFANHEFYDQFQGIPNDNISGFFYDSNANLWVATHQKGLYLRKAGSTKFSHYGYTQSILGNQINDIEGVDNRLFLATMGGLFVVDTKTKSVKHLTTDNGMPHNNINFVFKDQQNQIWLGPKSSGICMIDMNELSVEVHRLDNTPVDVADMTQDLNGNVWLATRGKGVLKYKGNDSIQSISVQNGLAKNFCHSITCDSQNRLWVCHHPGLSSIDLNKNGSVRTYGYENRMGGDFQQVLKDRSGHLWFASSDGVIQFFPERDKPSIVPPMLNFKNIEINGVKYKAGDQIELPYLYGKSYKFRFDFIGISFKNPEGVTYQYKLEKEGDESLSEWIDLGTYSNREYEFLPDGNFTFKVIAYNADGTVTPTPLAFQFDVLAPIWKKGWFILSVLLLIAYAIYLLIKYRERSLLNQKQVLENEVASQTVMLRKQNAEIERKNRDITDSINYAKKIQTSILPPISQLRAVFPDSFVIYLPRDIVSGDFYWFHQSKDYFVVSVADCTGHGVPGAFMSMIGSTLLSDIIKSKANISPAEILESLDYEIKILLQKNSVEQTQDGMDIAIVEIHVPTQRVRLASAKRPVYFNINNELSIYKGSRRSIGEESFEHDYDFVNIEYQLSKGDSVYLFSDGYSDQFGGVLGKKFMKSGVQKLVEQINAKPMYEQHQIFLDTFLNWKGELDQVDDVIFMGIKL